MPLSDAASRASGMLSDLKSRLGFSHDEDQYDDYDDYDDYEDDYDDGYDDYEDGYASRNDREYAGYGSDYGDTSSSGYRASSSRSSRFGRADSTPNLVSIDDVKAHTQVPDTLMRDPLNPSSGTTTTRRGRSLIANTGPAESSPAYNAAQRERSREAQTRSRSEGLNSLFEPSGGSGSYDPYEAYSSSSPSGYSSRRSLTIIKPTAYSDVERVARSVKAGDVVVLAMRNTPDDLSKRILDFSFGVASALDANVECPANKVFAIARGVALSENEKRDLRTQGVL